VACMLEVVGLIAQSLITFSRCLGREAALGQANSSSLPAWAGVAFPIAVVLIFGMYISGKARAPSVPAGEMDLYAFGQLPVMYEGRVKPFDTLARTSLRVISGGETFDDKDGKQQPAIRW